MKSRKTLTLGVNRELSEYRAQGTTGFGCHPGKMGASRLAIAGSRAIYSGKLQSRLRPARAVDVQEGRLSQLGGRDRV